MRLKTSKKIYAHIDCDSFFASCEILRNPELKGKYVCVGSEIIVAASYNAKALGVKVGTPIWEAKKILKNKNAYFCGVNMNLYKNISQKLMQYLKDGLIDVRIFSKIRKPFGCFVGCDLMLEKKNFQKASFFEIPFIGNKTQKKLLHEISSVQDYIELGYFAITQRFGKNGGKIWLELKGVNAMSFQKKKMQKSIMRARSFNREMTSNPQTLLKKIHENLDAVCDTLIEKNYEIRNISLLLIDKSWKKHTLTIDFPDYTHSRKQIFRNLQSLFQKIYTPDMLYRKTGVLSSDLRSACMKQLSIFNPGKGNSVAHVELEEICYSIQKKYGEHIIKRGI